MKDAPPQVKLTFSDCHSAFPSFTPDGEGRIFVRTWEKTQDGGGHYDDVFNPEGRYSAKIPLEIYPGGWKKDKLYTMEEDEEGYQVVERYKVEWVI